MFICMAGMPFSGKSVFVQAFIKAASNYKVVVVDPKEYLPDDIDDLPLEEQKKWRIASWEVCLKMTLNLMHEPHDTIIVLDTAASSSLSLGEIFTFARIKGHYIAYVFVASKVSECRQRAGTLWIGSESASSYVEKFKLSMPALKNQSNYSLTVKNSGEEGLNEIEQAANKLAAIAKQHAI